MTQRVKITVRGDDPRVELRGYIDGDIETVIGPFSEAMKPYGIVVGSFADDDYDPFKEGWWPEPVPLAISIREWAEGVMLRASQRGDAEAIDGAQKILKILDEAET